MKKLIDVECVTGMEPRANTSEVYTPDNGRKLVNLMLSQKAALERSSIGKFCLPKRSKQLDD